MYLFFMAILHQFCSIPVKVLGVTEYILGVNKVCTWEIALNDIIMAGSPEN